jgi:hypothetical protein
MRTFPARLAILAVLVTTVTACSSGGGPLVVGIQQDGSSSCTLSTGPQAWAAPVGFGTFMYWNQTSAPLTIDSVTLLDPHHLVLHRSVLYRMVHDAHSLANSAPWAQEGRYVPLADWRARQRIPGAVLPPAGGPVELNGQVNSKVDRWEIAVEVSAASPAGGWALGEAVHYEEAGQTYTVQARSGLAIGTSRGPAQHSCDAPMSAIQAAFTAAP